MPIPKLPDASNAHAEEQDKKRGDSRSQRTTRHSKSDVQGSPPQTNEGSVQHVINPVINPAFPQKQEPNLAPLTTLVPQNYQDTNGDYHMQGENKVPKYFEQETPSFEQLPSADVENPAEPTVVNPSPLTATDSSSALEESQELELIVELSKQLANHSPVVPGSQEVDARLDSNQIQEVNMQDTEPTAHLADNITIQDTRDAEEEDKEKQESPDNSIELIEESIPLGVSTPHKDQQPNTSITTNCGKATSKATSISIGLSGPAGPITARSFVERRQLTHIHALKQLVSSNDSLTSMAFDENDYRQAAILYENLNSTACFYTTALRLLSKSDWNMHVEFEDHIVHQAMKAVAYGWTSAVKLRNSDFGPFHLALAMCTLPAQVHGELQRTFDTMAVHLPAPFLQKLCSSVTFTCRVCGVGSSHSVSTFFALQPLPLDALGHDCFNAAVPWTDKLLPGGMQPHCDDCASSSDWTINTHSTSRLVWLQYPRASHPQATGYLNFLGKDPLFSGGCSWQCVALVIHQGHDPLYGEQQPADHFYILENEGPKCKFLCYNNAVGLHYIDDAKIKDGDRICGLFFRTTDITTKWSGQCTHAIRKTKHFPVRKPGQGKRYRNNGASRILLSSRRRSTPNKQDPQQQT